jgi:signal transduction histidine kinase
MNSSSSPLSGGLRDASADFHPPDARPARPAASAKSPAAAADDAAAISAVARISAVPIILRVVSEVTGMRLALVARVTEDRWTACAVLDRMNFGLHVGDGLDVATTLCSEVRDTRQPIVIERASTEPAYCAHPTPRMYGFESYIAVPIFLGNGEYFGNVCALDSAPATLRDDKTLAMMRLFAELISLQLTDEEESHRNRDALSLERRTGELREQFIAVLGHDLRTPLSAIVTGSAFLLELPHAKEQQPLLESIRASGARMSRLIGDIMDFARGRLGSGIPVSRESVDVARLAGDVVGEITSAQPARVIRLHAGQAEPALLDPARVAQMLSNLVGNAVEHGDPGAPIDVTVETVDGDTVFAITSRGRPIPRDVMPRLFQPFFREDNDRPRAGLGLGLYIASEIAHTHGGSITAESTDDGMTTFRVRLPGM